MVILEGLNGSFVGNQLTIFKARDTIKEAIEKINAHKKINKESVKEYLWAFDFIESLHGLDEKEKRCKRFLQKSMAKFETN
ncbi:MAG: hypothetical protein IKD77_01940 [Bacilli bacterium]|nr:hypothetical protein [Bacilli bacterium]